MQGLNLHLLHCRQILYCLSTQESPKESVSHSLKYKMESKFFSPTIQKSVSLSPIYGLFLQHFFKLTEILKFQKHAINISTSIPLLILFSLAGKFLFSSLGLNIIYCSLAQSCPTLCDPMDCSTPGFSFTISQSLLKLMSIESVMPSNHLVLCCPLFLLPSIFPNESALPIRWLNYWSFSISPSNEYSGLISFRIGWFDLLAI